MLACAATLIPLVYLVIRAGERGPASAAEVLGSGRTLTLLGNTVVLVVLVTTASVIVGVGMAWLVVRTDLPGAPVIGALLCVPLATPSYVLGYLWVADFPEVLGLPGAVAVLTISCYPYVFLPASAALRRVDPGLEEVARTLGHGTTRAVFGVTFRQIRPAVAAGGGCGGAAYGCGAGGAAAAAEGGATAASASPHVSWPPGAGIGAATGGGAGLGRMGHGGSPGAGLAGRNLREPKGAPGGGQGPSAGSAATLDAGAWRPSVASGRRFL